MSWFVILALLVNTLTVIFLIFVAIYFFQAANLSFPGQSQSWIAFVIALILGVICFLLGIWAVFLLLPSRKAVVVSAPVARQQVVTTSAVPLTTQTPQSDIPGVVIPPPMYH